MAYSIPANSLKHFTSRQLAELDPERIPEHVAIIMDGNRRWAKTKSLNVSEGHRNGADCLMDIVKAGKEIGIRVMTLFVFSTENWNRNRDEVMGIMWLFETYIRAKIPEMVQHRIRFQTIGDISKFPESVLAAISDAKEATKDCESLEIVFAMNYGARDEMKRAVQKIVAKNIQPEEITESIIAAYLDTSSFPDPELLIRSGGEERISNFLLWQLSYAELYMTKTLWPDFTPELLLEAVLSYQKRERRLGL